MNQISSNKQVINLWPLQTKEQRLGDLAKGIIARQRTKQKTAQAKYEDIKKGMIMRRLYHLAYSEKTSVSFPIEIHDFADKHGVTSCPWGPRSVDVDGLGAFKRLCAFFKSEGFDCSMTFRKIKSKNSDYWDLRLTVKGLAKKLT